MKKWLPTLAIWIALVVVFVLVWRLADTDPAQFRSNCLLSVAVKKKALGLGVPWA